MTNENTDKIYPVSMIGAGVPSPSGPPLDAPRSAPLPTPAANQIRPPSPMQNDGGMSLLQTLGGQQAPAVVPGLGFGSGVLSAIGGHPGGNPYLTQQHQQAQDQFEQNRTLTDMAQRVQDRQRQAKERQLEAQYRVSKELMASDNPNAQMAGAKGYSAWAGEVTGQTIDPAALVRRTELSEPDRKGVDGLIVAGISDDVILQRYPKLAQIPGYLQSERGFLKNPRLRKDLTGMTEDEEKVAANETRLKLTHQNNVQAAQDRINAGQGMPQDYFMVGATDEKEVGRQVFAQYVGTGQPIPPELKPYVDYYRTQLDSSGIKTDVQLAMAAHPGDPQAALAELRSLKRGEKKPTAAEFEMGVRLRQEDLLDKQRRGIPLTDAERREAAANDGYLRGDDNTKTAKGVTRKNVALTVNNAGRMQNSVNEVTKELTNSGTINTPGQFATDGRPKERVIEEEYHKQHPGQEIQVQWDNAKKQFQVIRLWDVTGGKADQTAAPQTSTTPAPSAKGTAKVNPILQGTKPPAMQTKEVAVAELQRLMGRGLSKSDAISEMKRQGWNVGG